MRIISHSPRMTSAPELSRKIQAHSNMFFLKIKTQRWFCILVRFVIKVVLNEKLYIIVGWYTENCRIIVVFVRLIFN